MTRNQSIRTVAIKVGSGWQPRIQVVSNRDSQLNRYSEWKPEYRDIWTERKLYASRDEALKAAETVLASAFTIRQ